MKRTILSELKHMVFKPTLRQLKVKELNESKMELMSAVSNMEFYSAMVQMYGDRITRLESEIGQEDLKLKVMPPPNPYPLPDPEFGGGQ